MAVFPPYDPVYSASKNSEAKRQTSKLGDGYESSVVFGLNRIRPEWTLQWVVEKEIAEQIEGFLQARADAAETFEWQPPDSSSLQKWKCEEWVVSEETYGVLKIDATFIKVFELSVVEVIPTPSECVDDICESDYGSYDNVPVGEHDVWVARLQGEGTEVHFTGSYTFENGYIYVAYCVLDQLYLAKFTQAGVVIWVKQYPNRFDSYYYPGNEVIHMTAKESSNTIFMTWQYDYSNGRIFRIVGINAITGIMLWSSDYRINAFFNGNCTLFSSTIQGQLATIKYDPNLNSVFAIASTGAFGPCWTSTSFDPESGIANVEYRTCDAGNDYYAFFGTGYLGSSKFTAGYFSGIKFVRGHKHELEGNCIYPETDDMTTINGTTPNYATIFENGQGCVIFNRINSFSTWEVMIFGDNGVIVDHAKYTTGLSMSSFNQNWPSYGNGPRQCAFATQVILVPEDSKIYVCGGTSSGIASYAIDVTLDSNNKIVSLGHFSKAISFFTKDSGNTHRTSGSYKFSAVNSAAPRVSGVIGKFISGGTHEVAVFSFNRKKVNTLGVKQYMSVGSDVTSAMGPTSAFTGLNVSIAPDRSLLKGYLVSSPTTGAAYSRSFTTECVYGVGGSTVFSVKSNVTEDATIDVTSSQQFALYTATL